MMKLCLVLMVVVGGVLGVQEYIDGEFFIRIKEHVDEEAFSQRLSAEFGLERKKVFHMGSLRILFVHGEEADVRRVGDLPEVSFWDRNAIFRIDQCTEQGAPESWGLDRIDQTAPLPYTDPLSPLATYTWGQSDGAGVNSYIVDTGIDIEHSEFGGRAVWGMSAGELPDLDDNGHGTACAGIVGSNSYGVSKSTTMTAVKVMNEFGNGFTDEIVEGLQWVLNNHTAGAKSVVNLSLGSGPSVAMDAAVIALIDGGLIVVIAAGNEDLDACNYSPGRVQAATTVGGTGVDDLTYIFTNWGTCVDIWAPGSNIKSTDIGPGDDTAVRSGTSMAAPHVVGAVARYMSSLSYSPTQDEVALWLNSTATQDAIQFRPADGPGSPNLLLYVNCP